MNPEPFDRGRQLARLREPREWDLAVIGGGATGLGVALDAAARGFSVLLLEGDDFAKGTSSRATKLVHGGVRYLAQGDIGLVREALHERTTLLANAPHVAQRLAFVVPGYRLMDLAFYGVGLKMYDVLAGRQSLGADAGAVRQPHPGGAAHRAPAGPGRRGQVLGRAVRRRAVGRAAGAHRHPARCGGAEPCAGHRLAARRRQGERAAGARRRKRRRLRAARALRGQCHRRVGGRGARHGPRCRRARPAGDGGAQPGRAPDRRPRLHARHARADGAQDRATAACCSPCLGSARRSWAPPTRRATTWTREPTPFREEVDFILREAGRYLSQGADARRRALGVGGVEAAGQAAGRRGRQHQGAVARAHGDRRALRPGDGDRRQVDHLPRHGRRRARPLHGQRQRCRANPVA